jgi:hypothetical protein
MSHLQINYGTGCEDIFVPDQLFMFGSMIFSADSAGHLAPVENYTPYQIMTFGSLDYTTLAVSSSFQDGLQAGSRAYRTSGARPRNRPPSTISDQVL